MGGALYGHPGPGGLGLRDAGPEGVCLGQGRAGAGRGGRPLAGLRRGRVYVQPGWYRRVFYLTLVAPLLCCFLGFACLFTLPNICLWHDIVNNFRVMSNIQ